MESAGLRWIELNLGAPHGREASAVCQVTAQDAVRNYVRTVRRAVSIPLAVKLTAQADDPLALARIAMEEGADMLVLTGRIQGFMPDIETQKPILGSWGAIGGRLGTACKSLLGQQMLEKRLKRRSHHRHQWRALGGRCCTLPFEWSASR
jgi:Dihydroorotate dehydrogenase